VVAPLARAHAGLATEEIAELVLLVEPTEPGDARDAEPRIAEVLFGKRQLGPSDLLTGRVAETLWLPAKPGEPFQANH
jgi:hypothetical protein